jgi:hypothetical protein
VVSPAITRWERRLRLVLWAGVGAAVVALVVIIVLSFRPHGPTHRHQVVSYINSVNHVELAARSQARAIQSAFRDFSRGTGSTGQQVRELQRAREQMRALRGQLAALPVPPDARRLRGLYLRLLDAEIAFAGNVAALARYSPRLAEAQAPLRAANAALHRAVVGTPTADAQARAFADYAHATAQIAGRVASVPAPSLFAPVRDAEAARLRRLSGLAAQISGALTRKDSQKASELFGTLSRVAGSPTVARVQREATLAYNRRLQAIGRIAAAIDKERTRLDKSLE